MARIERVPIYSAAKELIDTCDPAMAASFARRHGDANVDVVRTRKGQIARIYLLDFGRSMAKSRARSGTMAAECQKTTYRENIGDGLPRLTQHSNILDDYNAAWHYHFPRVKAEEMAEVMA